MTKDFEQNFSRLHGLIVSTKSRYHRSSLFKQFVSIALILLLGTASYGFVSHFIFQSVCVSGSSMAPTLFNTGSYWLNRSVYLGHPPARGDIVAIRDPQDGELIVKRIIALPGESVWLRNGTVYVNNRPLAENYLASRTKTFAYGKSADEFACCPNDRYFVLGDNRSNSTDSRIFGTVPRASILGKVVK